MDIQQLYDNLQKMQEPQGYYFNKNREKTFELLEALITNKERYGYMSCPCRLASGIREYDKDIICPCEYRTPDIQEYHSCFCSLYVTQDWNEGKISKGYIPERRPADKMIF